MTQYHGGKNRIGKYIANFIHNFVLEYTNEFSFKPKYYIEPFCGMCGVMAKIIPLFEDSEIILTYKAGDINNSVIKMWNAAMCGWTPPANCSKKEYNIVINDKDSAEKGYLGHVCTYRGSYCGAYFKNKQSKLDSNRNRVIEYGKIFKSVDVKFSNGQYTQFSKAKNSIIYCDPPYDNTEQRYIEKFDFDMFKEWCIKMSRNNIVLVSSYDIDDPNFILVFEHGKEKLYFVDSGY